MYLFPYDLETTSPEPATTRAVQCAYIAENLDDPTDIETFNQMCNPGLQISDGAFAVHGISNEMVADMPSDTEVLGKLYDVMADNIDDIVVATHNGTTFDLPILWRITGRPPLPVKHIDTIVCSTRCYPRAPCHKLSQVPSVENGNKAGLIQWLGLGSGEGAHDALADIRMVATLVKHFMQLDGGKTVTELADWCAKPRVLTVCHFGKHAGKPYGSGAGCVPRGWARFIADLFEDPSLDMVVTMLHHYNVRFSKVPHVYKQLGV